ncbi:hypothetical protein [Levilactobacillus yiduensis]|uniref:hypothetical protein n=1 Tax=Levilactobacillus yiduensis TaxID=2953880 RepID=UPI000EF2A570|nr:hypothetical protein [Levilactobacillus yiduensis]AYM02667.1 hypothetical protein D8911_06510 [Levilactobacillus brevis]
MNKRLKKSLLISVAALSLGVGFTAVNETATTTVMAAKKYKVIKTKKLKKYRVSYKHNGPVYSKANLSKKRTTLKKIKKDKLYVTKQETVRKHKKSGKAYNSRYLYVKDISHSKKSGWIHNSNLKKYKKSNKDNSTANDNQQQLEGQDYIDSIVSQDNPDKNIKSYSYSKGVDIAKSKFISFVNSERAKAGVPVWIHDSGDQQVADIRAEQLAKLDNQSHYTNPDTDEFVYYPNSSTKMPMFNKVENDLGFLNNPWKNSMLTHSNESVGELGDLKDGYGKITDDSIESGLVNGLYSMITYDEPNGDGHKDMLLNNDLKYYAVGTSSRKNINGENEAYVVIISSDAPLQK